MRPNIKKKNILKTTILFLDNKVVLKAVAIFEGIKGVWAYWDVI